MKPQRMKWARQVLFFVVSGLAGYGAVHLTRHHDVSLTVGLLLLFSVFAVVTIVHELGHMAGARIAGWKAHLIAVGLLPFRTEAGTETDGA
jgi:branched-subunit amino acid ABC-type transport system permease component